MFPLSLFSALFFPYSHDMICPYTNLIFFPNRLDKLPLPQGRGIRDFKHLCPRFKFIPHKYYKQDFGVTQAKVLAYMEGKFFNKVFIPVMTAVSKEKKIGVSTSTDNESRMGGGGGAGGEEEEEREGQEKSERTKEEAADKAMGDMDSSDDEVTLVYLRIYIFFP